MINNSISVLAMEIMMTGITRRKSQVRRFGRRHFRTRVRDDETEQLLGHTLRKRESSGWSDVDLL